MSALSIQPTYPIFTDIDGQPLEAGYVWIGAANLDPQTNPINVYWDAALTILAPQPIRTLAGYPANNGTPARLYVNSDYSIRVMNKNGSTVYSAPAATERYNASVVGEVNASNVVYDPAGTGSVSTTVETQLRNLVLRSNYDTQANFDAAKVDNLSVDSDTRVWANHYVAGYKEFGHPGDTFPGAPALLDGFTVSRDVLGATDHHAFSDKSVIDQVTDYGGYGTFDATTILRGSHTQNHLFAFQDRLNYQGSGVLENLNGLWSTPEMHGSGTINSRMGIRINDVNKTSGTILEQNGIQIDNLQAANVNVALHIRQQAGWAIYAPGGAQSYLQGRLSVGFDNDAFGYQAIISAKNTGGKTWFVETDAANIFSGIADGDGNVKTVIGNNVRFGVYGLADSYCVAPGVDNTQPLGTAGLRWSVVYAGTGTINTSDEREKQDIENLDDAEKRVAASLKGLIKKFRFKDAVEKKGNDARIHVGVIAQDVIEAFKAHGLDPMRYGIICYDEWDAKDAVIDGSGNIVEPARKVGNRYGIRYEELMSFIIAAL